MAYTTIDNPELYFQTKLYTGSGSIQAITLDGDENMQPDFIWCKSRSETRHHYLADSVRGVKSRIRSDATNAEYTADATNGFDSFDSDGFTLEEDSSSLGLNESSHNMVAYCWKAGTSFTNDASATSVGNTDSSGSASSTAGFSIAKWVGAGASLDIQVKHGLSAVPAVMWVKNIEEAGGGNSWAIYHHKNTSAPETDYLKLDSDSGTTDQAEVWNDTAPTSAVFTAGDFSGSNRSGDDFIGYFWNEVQGFSKFGGYTGNGNANGTFVYTGFRPAWVIQKRTDTSGQSWSVFDSKREGYNVDNDPLYADTNDAEGTTDALDFLSNGFKIRANRIDLNASGSTYIYMAFAEQPFVNSSGVPANAR